MTPAEQARLYAEAYAAGLAEGRRQAARDAAVRLRQVAVDLLGQSSGSDMILGNSSGVGSVASLEAGR